MPNAGKSSPLIGLELTQEVIHSTEAAGRQTTRRAIGLEIAEAILGGPLEWAMLGDGPAVVNADTGEVVEGRAAAFAALLAMAADPSNHAAGVLDDGHGGTFHGGSCFWKSSLRLDPNHMESMRRRSRGRARSAIRRMMDSLTPEETMARKYGWAQRSTLKLLTLTMPHIDGSNSFQEVRRNTMAMTLFKKRAWWRDLVVGGIKGTEDALDADGPHVHAHILILSKYIDREELKTEWKACLDAATRKIYGFGLDKDQIVIVDVRKVKRKGRSGLDCIGIDAAIDETTKYVTKPQDFLKRDATGRRVSQAVLLELCEVRRWPRMFELLGRCRDTSHPARASEVAKAAQAALSSIHRAYSTGEHLKIPKSVGWEWVESWDPEVDGPEEKRKLVVAALKHREAGGDQRPRPPSWRDLMDKVGLQEWLSIMAERFRRGREFRIQQIMEQNPSAYLVAFSGRIISCAVDI